MQRIDLDKSITLAQNHRKSDSVYPGGSAQIHTQVARRHVRIALRLPRVVCCLGLRWRPTGPGAWSNITGGG